MRFILIFVLICQLTFGQNTILDSISKNPVSYATISFGNGNGIFADDEGVFVFNQKLYPDIDSLFISALGYKDLNISAKELPVQLFLSPETEVLDEVVIGIKRDRKFMVEKQKPYLDDDYYNCWLPTIESEIAVFIPNPDERERKFARIIFPIALESKDWSKRNRSNAEKKPFSTLFKVKFYKNDNGLPGKVLTYETIVFRATEEDGDQYELNVEAYNINMPNKGAFVSIQVMGYTDKKGKLLPNKKYKEIKQGKDIVKIPTNFRPLLPFTNEIATHQTFVKRVFINNNQWVCFKNGNGFKSTLLDNGYFNYGLGYNFNLYKND